MKDLNFELLTLCRRNRDGSYSTRSRRLRSLQAIADLLHELGFQHMHLTSLKDRHVVALVEHWKKSGLNSGTMQNYMSDLRWWAEKARRTRSIRRKNSDYGIPARSKTYQNRAQVLSEEQLEMFEDPYLRMSLRLQQWFGLRREESMKFRPSYADKGDHIALKGSWTKGGRPRSIPVVETVQRDLIDQIRNMVGSRSLIPDHLRYVDQLNRYTSAVAKAGLRNLHGLRHGYAQRRYFKLAGWQPPAMGGPTYDKMTANQQETDQWARLTVSRELGHNRVEITSVYLG